MIRDRDHLTGMVGVGNGVADGAEGRRTGRAADVAETIHSRRGDHGHVYGQLPPVDGPGPAAVRSHDDRFRQGRVQQGLAQRIIDDARVQTRNDAFSDMPDQGSMRRKQRGGGDLEIAQAKSGGRIQRLVQHMVAVAQVVVKGQGHAVFDLAGFQRLRKTGDRLVTHHGCPPQLRAGRSAAVSAWPG